MISDSVEVGISGEVNFDGLTLLSFWLLRKEGRSYLEMMIMSAIQKFLVKEGILYKLKI